MPRRRSSLRRWRDLIDGGEVEIDWRARLHPSARPQISTSASSAAKESVVERDLTDATAADSARDGRANRRSFTSEEKLAIVLECEQPWNNVSAVARATDLPRVLCSAGAPSLGMAENRKQNWRQSCCRVNKRPTKRNHPIQRHSLCTCCHCREA